MKPILDLEAYQKELSSIVESTEGYAFERVKKELQTKFDALKNELQTAGRTGAKKKAIDKLKDFYNELQLRRKKIVNSGKIS